MDIQFAAATTPRVSKEDLPRVVEAVGRRQPGPALYTEVLRASRPVSQFRDYWRVLESAFGCADEELVTVLARYAPAVRMRFTHEELSDLWVLRGIASHASGKKSIQVVRKPEAEVTDRLPRLRTLTERVLFTKKTWGLKTGAVEELTPHGLYLGPSGKRLSFGRERRPSAKGRPS